MSEFAKRCWIFFIVADDSTTAKIGPKTMFGEKLIAPIEL